MKLDANVSLGAVVRAMGVSQLKGAIVKAVRVTVTYRVEGQDGIAAFQRNGGDRLMVRNAEVDRDEAIDVLSEDGWHFDEDVEGPIDPRDLHDFIAACSAGDRCTALALVPRLFTGSNAMTAEQLLTTRASQLERRIA
ncbi:hypothetical protein IWY39_000554 [Sphingobium sp. JAI105]|uniref:hypothetical protein n=1 Tax=Sphingobium sp. JAI105 TaxID=2787715 RepID=UPI0018CAF1C9|nr:hypothetical protein [Sphingobium sp. JAI105]MBG6116750.1 hypothetical protein [Sphingobium sp. JAI105]